MKFKLLGIIILLSILSGSAYSYDIFYGDYSEEIFTSYIDIPVVAAIPNDNIGILGRVRIAIGKGTEKIVFDTRSKVDYTTVNSVIKAINYANMTGYDYFISYDLSTKEVKGGSTGASVALGLIALKESKYYDESIIVTGDIDEFGNLMDSGGIALKILPLSGKTLVAQGEDYIYFNSGGSVIARKAEKFAEEKKVKLLRIDNLSVIKDKVIKQKL